MRGCFFQLFAFLLIPLLGAGGHLAYSGWFPPHAVELADSSDQLLKIPGAIWIDARDEEKFREGHVPRAVNLNRQNWTKALPALFEVYEEGKMLVVYCSRGCHESTVIASKLRELGLENVKVLEGGYEAWQKRDSRR